MCVVVEDLGNGAAMSAPLVGLSVVSSIRYLLQAAGDTLATDRSTAKRFIDRAIALLNTAPVRTTPLPGRDMSSKGLAAWQARRLSEYIDKRLDSALSTTELAQAANLSVGYFCHAFKRSFGLSPHAYVMAKRVERAQKMILTTNEPLSQIAVSCGLADQSHLSRVFRRALGYSPSAWRRHCRTSASMAASHGFDA
jgi:AraC-like DNA-binding protein